MVRATPPNPLAVGGVENAYQWLPMLAPLLPVAVPLPLGQGRPAEGYPWPWSVYLWLKGENPAVDRLADPGSLAAELAQFVAALQRIDPTGAPRAGRGVPLAERDAPTRTAIDELLGDPAGDLAVAWNLFPPDTRNLVRAALRVDDATWERGRGWALSIALIQVPYYQSTNAVLAASARHVINEVLADHARVSC